MLSAVRQPTPPLGGYPEHAYNPRKRSPPSRSPSPDRRGSGPGTVTGRGAVREDINSYNFAERPRKRQIEEPAKPPTEEDKQAAAKKEYHALLNSRSGGRYVPPAKLRALQQALTDKTSKEYQRMAWEALKKSINGLINKVNVANIKAIVPELFAENLIRGRGLFCRSIQKSAATALPFVPVYAAMAAIVNTKLPQVGELLIHRLIVQFKKAFKRNDKAVCLSSVTFLAHLTNQQVVAEILPAQILLLLLHHPTDDSVEIAVALLKEVGQFLEEFNPAISMAVFDQLRSILHDSEVEKRTQYQIEVLFQIRKDKFRDQPSIPQELDLVEEEDQITHRIGLDDEINVQDSLNIFKYDPDYEENENKYKALKAEILGEAEGSDEEYESGSESEDEETKEQNELEIKDATNTDLVNLRRTIYLTIMSSSVAEEASHKLMKLNLPAGQESELVSMIVECCSQERTYNKFYGIIAETFAKINRLWRQLLEESFATAYDTCHRRETNQLRNVARLYGHLISTDSIGWECLSVIQLNEEDTTSSSRIFIKILFQDLSEALGMKKLQERLQDPLLRPHFAGLFPTDNQRNTRFSINYFTSVGMGGLTDEMREILKNAPKPAAVMPAPEPESDSESVSSYSSYSSYSTSSRSYSRSRSSSRSRRIRSRQFSRSRSRTPPRRNGGRAISRTPPRQNGLRARSRTPLRRNVGRDRSLTPPRRNGNRDRSVTPRRPYSGRDRSLKPPRRQASRDTRREAPVRRDDRRGRSLTPSDVSRSPSPRRVRRRRSSPYSSRSPSPMPRLARRRRS